MRREQAIEVVDLNVSYVRSDGSRKTAVENFSLQVKRGEIVSIVGPSGCGKTSVLRSIAGEVRHEGTCTVNVQEAGALAYLRQSPALLPWRNALENAALGQEVRGLLTSDSIARVEETLLKFGLDRASVLAYPDELSMGMQQRVAVARALESNAKVLLCDEPFSAVDYINRLTLNTIFKRRCFADVAVLLVTHNIDEAIYLSSRVCVMAGSPGRIVAEVEPAFQQYVDDPVAMRTLPEFETYFSRIWQSMSGHGH